MATEDYAEFAETEEEAEARFTRTKSNDPFPDIQPSLLNSADVSDYVRLTGMLMPFHLEKLKPASYEAGIYGRCIWWDASGQWQEKRLLQDSDDFTLEANSIAFVQVEPTFRLPDYMALRFNLKITHVHRGILLGTGPLVDPGFVGKLLIPLHNLTTNHYTFRCGEGLIWVEFTKTSTLPERHERGPRRRAVYKPFPDDKKNLEPEIYFRKASQNRPIRSSIPEAIRISTSSAQASAIAAQGAAAEVTALTARFRRLSVLGTAVLAITLAALLIGTWQLIGGAWTSVAEVQTQLRNVSERVNTHDVKTEELAAEVARLKNEVAEGRSVGKRAGEVQQAPGGSRPKR